MKQKMKKVLPVLLALSMLFSLVACDGSTGETGDGWQLRREKLTQEEMDQTPTEDQLITLDTACGQIQGIQQDGYREFRGVRYATAERWEQAQPVESWDGVYDATTWGDGSCQYFGFYHMADSTVSQFYMDEAIASAPIQYSEDSLNLNIWTPDDAEDCPVLVYIHGGSYMTGSNTDASTDGEAYAHHGVITVAINYRLGPFHSVYGDGYTGNLALTDQLTALRWVKENIADYGGDPNRITVMGESAGAVSVQNLLISPLVEDGLISGAIMLSGGGDLSSIGSPTTPELVEPIWTTLKQNLGVSSIDQLKELPADELYAAWLKALGAYSGTATTPVLDGVALTQDVGEALKQNTVKDVPCIIGMLSEDMWPLTLYNAATGYAQSRAEAGGKPVYLYYFDRQQPGDNSFGAFHAADLYYVFGTLYRNQRPFDDTDYRIAENMIDYISNFVKTGDPNGSGLTQWESATTEDQKFIHFGDEAPSMVEPDIEALSATQLEGWVFPYADSIAPPEIEDTPTGEKGAPIAPADLLGTWDITGWNVLADGSFVPVTDQTFEFLEDELYYDISGETASACYYTFENEFDIALRNFDAAETDAPLIWTLYLNEDGQLLIEDPTYAIAYVCVKQDDGGQTGVEPTHTPIAPADLLGTWDITGWNVLADGSFVPVTDQTFEFLEDELYYDISGETASACYYTFENEFDIALRNFDAAETDAPLIWTLYLNEDGQLLIEDPTYAIAYVCIKADT